MTVGELVKRAVSASRHGPARIKADSTGTSFPLLEMRGKSASEKWDSVWSGLMQYYNTDLADNVFESYFPRRSVDIGGKRIEMPIHIK